MILQTLPGIVYSRPVRFNDFGREFVWLRVDSCRRTPASSRFRLLITTVALVFHGLLMECCFTIRRVLRSGQICSTQLEIGKYRYYHVPSPRHFLTTLDGTIRPEVAALYHPHTAHGLQPFSMPEC
ncbi:hypothetical protein BV898_14491 [Hypsibius exemplaris]|uniref:Uncharacterized protein n=1 Tax=Hypsibius exemplaris TaxID=2072580 RepID=A0A9X6NID9_HYPEX|nr:hypothetical protein BV898_14491 [Hypsibius exemplaris]